jgi:lipopolysaccharide/colanic/teichoic acid biosynthesis glycosyltransferase
MSRLKQLSEKITPFQEIRFKPAGGPLPISSEPLIDMIRAHDPDVVGMIPTDRNSYYRTKRVLDVVFSVLLLLLLLPIMIIIAAAIYLSSPGPVIFVQDRVGVKQRYYKNHPYWKKENYRNYKFRTMSLNADTSIHQAYMKALIEKNEEEMAALQGEETESRKLVNDSRIFGLGRFLRKFSLDELPQLFNVLRGEMSLVGPRPAIPYEVEMYQPWHYRRLETRPGITGLQQVKARSTDFDQQVCLDIEYIERQSLWLDIKIMFSTIWSVLSTKGAY